MTLAKTALVDASDYKKKIRNMKQWYVIPAAFYSVFQQVTFGFLINSSRSLTCCLSRFWHFHISFKALKVIEDKNSGFNLNIPYSDKIGVSEIPQDEKQVILYRHI